MVPTVIYLKETLWGQSAVVQWSRWRLTSACHLGSNGPDATPTCNSPGAVFPLICLSLGGISASTVVKPNFLSVTTAGLESARARGRRGGRSKALDKKKAAMAGSMHRGNAMSRWILFLLASILFPHELVCHQEAQSDSVEGQRHVERLM